jgi:transposase
VSSITLEIVKHHEAKRGFILLPKRWVAERTFGWPGRFRRLARDYERLADTLKNGHWLAFLGPLMSQIRIQTA